MKLSEKRMIFSSCLADLIHEMNSRGYGATIDDVKARDGHCHNSLHYLGLAADINLFKNGEYLTRTEDHEQFGEYWESLHDMNVWGGRFKNKDGNHYQFGS